MIMRFLWFCFHQCHTSLATYIFKYLFYSQQISVEISEVVNADWDKLHTWPTINYWYQLHILYRKFYQYGAVKNQEYEKSNFYRYLLLLWGYYCHDHSTRIIILWYRNTMPVEINNCTDTLLDSFLSCIVTICIYANRIFQIVVV